MLEIKRTDGAVLIQVSLPTYEKEKMWMSTKFSIEARML
jgi:hypothetical protein